MSLFHSNGKNSCFTEDALMMSLQSFGKDSSLEENKAKRDDKPSSSHLSTRSETIQTKKNPATTCWSREKYALTAGGKPRHDADYWINLARAQEKGLQFLAKKISSHNCSQYCAGILHLQKWFSQKTNDLYMKDSHLVRKLMRSTESLVGLPHDDRYLVRRALAPAETVREHLAGIQQW